MGRIVIPRTDLEREAWVSTHEGLNFDRRRKGMTLSQYVKANRMVIDEVIRLELEKGSADRNSLKA